jgi:hypothetical protein
MRSDRRRRQVGIGAILRGVDAKTADGFQPRRQKRADGDIYPLRLREEVTNFMQREAILSVGGLLLF